MTKLRKTKQVPCTDLGCTLQWLNKNWGNDHWDKCQSSLADHIEWVNSLKQTIITGRATSTEQQQWHAVEVSMEEVGFVAPNNLRRLLKQLEEVMPYLAFVPSRKAHIDSSVVAVFHKGHKVPAGTISYAYGKWKISAPTIDTADRVKQTKNIDTALSTCRSHLKFLPPEKVSSYLAIDGAYRRGAFRNYSKSLWRDLLKTQAHVRTENFGDRNVSERLFHYLVYNLDNVPESVRLAIQGYKDLRARANEYDKIVDRLLYMKLRDGVVGYRVFNTGYDSLKHLAESYHLVPTAVYDHIGELYEEPMEQLPEEVIGAIGMLSLEDINDYMPQVGMRLGEGEFLVYANEFIDKLGEGYE